MQKCTNAQHAQHAQKHKCSNARIHKCTNMQMLKMQNCSKAQTHKMPRIHKWKVSGVQHAFQHRQFTTSDAQFKSNRIEQHTTNDTTHQIRLAVALALQGFPTADSLPFIRQTPVALCTSANGFGAGAGGAGGIGLFSKQSGPVLFVAGWGVIFTYCVRVCACLVQVIGRCQQRSKNNGKRDGCVRSKAQRPMSVLQYIEGY